jgi:hypothetical protein
MVLCDAGGLIVYGGGAMKKNAGGAWFSTKRRMVARSMLVQEVGDTLKRKTEIAKRLRDSALRDCPQSAVVLESLIGGESQKEKEG